MPVDSEESRQLFFRAKGLACAGDWRGLYELVSLHPELAQAADELGNTLLIYVAHQRAGAEAIAWLLKRGAPANLRNKEGTTSLEAALVSSMGHDMAEKVEALLKHGADANQHLASGWTPLHYAIFRGELRVVHSLLRHGANPMLQSRDREPSTAYDIAALVSGKDEIVSLLDSRGGGGQLLQNKD